MASRLDPFFLLALVVVLTIHEFSHALAAEYLGDPTAKLKGRLTLNPLAHLDPVGALAFILFGFGWAKPVPIDPFNLQNPQRDSMLISLAGPGSNLISAIFLAFFLRLPFNNLAIEQLSSFYHFFYQAIVLSVIVAVFNLIPIHPLDGGKILVGLLPQEKAHDVDLFLHRYGMFILLLLLVTGSFGAIISPVVKLFLSLLLPNASTVI